jgi:hypothetical protein
MSSTEALFKSIDDAADKIRIEKESEWEREYERKTESYKRVSECEFLMHSSGFPAPDPLCLNPKRSKITTPCLTYPRDCLGADCPLFQ